MFTKFNIGDSVMIRGTVRRIEITKEGVIYYDVENESVQKYFYRPSISSPFRVYSVDIVIKDCSHFIRRKIDILFADCRCNDAFNIIRAKTEFIARVGLMLDRKNNTVVICPSGTVYLDMVSQHIIVLKFHL